MGLSLYAQIFFEDLYMLLKCSVLRGEYRDRNALGKRKISEAAATLKDSYYN